MKLYTEEQVKNFLKERTFMTEDAIDKLCAPLTPIELPSDEDIEVERKRYGVHGVLFSDGAKWMKEQILNQNKAQVNNEILNRLERIETKLDRVIKAMHDYDGNDEYGESSFEAFMDSKVNGDMGESNTQDKHTGGNKKKYKGKRKFTQDLIPKNK